MTPYKEVQRMTQWWILLPFAVFLGLGLWAIIVQIGFGHPIGDKPASNLSLLFIALTPAVTIGLVLAFSLTTDVTAEGIRVRYFPVWSASVKWQHIKDVQLIKYGFVGYGIRFSSEYGTVYNAKGNIGLLVRKTDGSRLLIGTQQPDAFLNAVNQYLNVSA